MSAVWKVAELRCPDCGTEGKIGFASVAGRSTLLCGTCAARYDMVAGRPVLIAASNPLFDRARYAQTNEGGIYRTRRLRLRLPSPSVNLSQKRMLRRLGADLPSLGFTRVLVVGSGKQRLKTEREMSFGAGAALQVVCCDIDVSAEVDIYCDAHDLPFSNGVFDAVITTAVLEHVMYPEKVAAEIARVTRLGGLLYSELPFLQSVHEGAYDFTRYTMSGHRRLFNYFDSISFGMVAGPGTALVWSIEHFAANLFGRGALSRAARAGARLLFFWIKYVDHLLTRSPIALDSASCTYIYGRRRDTKVPDAEIVAAYEGGRKISHV